MYTFQCLQALQYSMSFFDAEKSGTLTSNDIAWRGNSALTDALNDSSLVGGFYDGANGMPSCLSAPTSKIFCFFTCCVLASSVKHAT